MDAERRAAQVKVCEDPENPERLLHKSFDSFCHWALHDKETLH